MKTSVILKNTGVLMGLALAILAVSCEKDPQFLEHEETTVEGRLLSAADRSPIAHGKVLLLVDDLGTLTSAIWHGRSFGIRNVITADAQGRFSYRFKHSEDSVYAVAAEAEGYFPNRNSGGYPYPQWEATGLQRLKRGYINYFTQPRDEKDFQHEKGTVYYPEIRLAPEGWIRFHIVNEPPSFPDDLMKLLPESSNLQTINFSGEYVNQRFISKPIRAGRYSRVLYNVTSQGEFQYYTDSIYVEPHDTVLYELEY